jgi:hypothetical protein
MVGPLVIAPAVPPAAAATGWPCTRPPLASFIAQKNVSSRARPIVYPALLAGIPIRSSFNKAHGRGVVKLTNLVAGHLLWLDVCVITGEWLHQLQFALNQSIMVRGKLPH